MNVKHQLDTDQQVSRDAMRVTTAIVLRHPTLWWSAAHAAVRFAPRGWWRHAPFLPVPDERYWRFRMETAYGDERARVGAEDLDDVLRWAHRARARRR
ncbi:MAG TPA: hypothetical protein VIE15_06810 [Acidimicrobiales bacterium]